MPLFPPGSPNATVTSLFSSTATQVVAATTDELTIIGPGTGLLTLPADFLKAGGSLRFSFRGLYSTPPDLVGSLTLRVKLGGAVLAFGAASSLPAGVADNTFDGECLVTCRSKSEQGSVVIMGGLSYSVGNNRAALKVSLNNKAAASPVNTTTKQVFDVTAQWSDSALGNSLSSLSCVLEALN